MKPDSKNITRLNQFKRLNVPGWFIYEIENASDTPKEYPLIERRFKKDGWYYDRLNRISWIEYKEKAYAYNDPKMFLYDVEQLTFKERRPREDEFILIEKMLKMKSSSLQNLLVELRRISIQENHIRTLRKMTIDSYKFFKDL